MSNWNEDRNWNDGRKSKFKNQPVKMTEEIRDDFLQQADERPWNFVENKIKFLKPYYPVRSFLTGLSVNWLRRAYSRITSKNSKDDT